MGTYAKDFIKTLGVVTGSIDESELGDKFETISREDIDNKGSMFGNFYFEITANEILSLLEGKALYCMDEYGIFVYLSDETMEELHRLMVDDKQGK